MINFAHRGDSSNFPENTMLSFKEAIKKGADGIELDVHKTRDNELVVIHDETVDRTYLGRGYVKDYSLKELSVLKSRSRKFRNNKECYIPTLIEVLELIKDTGLILNIEIKNDLIKYNNIEEDVIELVKKYQMMDRVIISSFNHESLLKCKEICSEIKTGMLYSSQIENFDAYVKKYKVDALHPSFFLVSEEYIKQAHQNNLQVNVYTVNIPELMKMLIRWDIDGIITDCPSILREITNN